MFLAPMPGSFDISVDIDNSLLRYYFRLSFFIIIIRYFKFYLTNNYIGVLCGVSGICMHRQGRGELAPFDLKIE